MRGNGADIYLLSSFTGIHEFSKKEYRRMEYWKCLVGLYRRIL